MPGLEGVYASSVHSVELLDHGTAQLFPDCLLLRLIPAHLPQHPLELVIKRRIRIVVEGWIVGEEVADWVGLSLSLWRHVSALSTLELGWVQRTMLRRAGLLRVDGLRDGGRGCGNLIRGVSGLRR